MTRARSDCRPGPARGSLHGSPRRSLCRSLTHPPEAATNADRHGPSGPICGGDISFKLNLSLGGAFRVA